MKTATKGICFTWTGKACGVNNRYVNRSYNLTTEYRHFRDDVANTCWTQNPGQRLTGNVVLVLQLTIDPARDSDSLLKPIFDGIERSGVLENDRQIRSYKVTVEAKRKGAPDEVRVMGWEKSKEAKNA